MVLEIVLGIIITVMAIGLVALVLLQSGKDKRLSGSIAGVAETFFAGNGKKTDDKMLSRITTIASFVFVILVVAFYLIVC
jgi:preprotein translocase subunit SecG